MILLIFIVLCVYYLLFCYSTNSITTLPRPAGDPPESQRYTYGFTSKGVLFTPLGYWEIPQHPDYYFTGDDFLKKDECFEKPDGAKVPASGHRLYDFIHDLQQQNVQFNVTEFTKRGKRFFFECEKGHLKDLHMCGSGDTFEVDHCVPVNPCTDGRDGDTFADLLDLRKYYKCLRGELVHKKCPADRLFISGKCSHPDACTEWYDIDGVNYVKCLEGVPVLSKCPPRMRFFEDSKLCEPDLCDGSEDGQIPMRPKLNASFLYSEGYVECKKGRVIRKTYCPRHWSEIDEILFHLPSVYDGTACTDPSFCENVYSDDPEIIVPVFEFQKYATEWPRSRLFDEVVGYRCVNGQKKRTPVRPGNHIREYREISACDDPTRRVVVGDRIDRYYDCDTGSVVQCPPETFFNRSECKARIPLAHSLKGVDILTYEGLSPINGWMVPPTYSNEAVKKCSEPESKYIKGYNVCADPDCEKYPFLKQVPISISDGDYACVYDGEKIIKREVPRNPNLFFSFWEQRILNVDDPLSCIPGQKTNSGFFTVDSGLYATCDVEQPFVFCPSPFTKGIVKNSYNRYVCEPEDSVYEGIVPPNTKTSFYKVELKSFLPTAAYFIDGERKEYDGQAVNVDAVRKEMMEIWSEGEIHVHYNEVVTYPPNNYFEDKLLKTYTDNYILKEKGSTQKPLSLANHNFKQV